MHSILPMLPGCKEIRAAVLEAIELAGATMCRLEDLLPDAEGIVGGGYAPVRNITMCVTNALKKASTEKYETIVTPLMGVGMGGELRRTVEKLMTAAIAFLEENSSPSVCCIYFIAWSPWKLSACLGFLDNLPEAKFLPPGNPLKKT